MRDEPRVGEVFAGHLIEAEIGRGGMGIVLLARDIALDQRRAIKLIAPELSADPAFAARFRRESRLAASVEHPNVVGVHHAGEEGGLLYIVMPYIDGVDLGRVLEDGPVAPARGARIISGIAAALDAAHDAGLVHRDVKPANVLLEPQAGGGERVFLTDFGISKPVSTGSAGGATAATALTGFGEVLGTADYTAPEQIEDGHSDGRSDVYALACVAFHALCGAPPFHRDTELATLIAQTKAPRPSATAANPRLPPAIDGPIRDGMAIDPRTRPASAGALARRIEAVLKGGEDPDPSGSDPDATADAGRRRQLALTAAAMMVVAALAAGAALLLNGEDGDGEPAPTVATSAPGAVGAGPTGVAAGEVRIWVAARDADRVDRLRRARPEPSGEPIAVPEPRQVAIGFNSIWVVNGERLYRLDPEQGSDPVPIEVGSDPGDVDVDFDYVWVSDESDGTLTRIDPDSNEVTGRVELGGEPRAIATGKGAVFVANGGSGTVARIDAASLEPVGEPVQLGGQPTSIDVGSRAVWVADNKASTLVALRPGTLDPITDAPIEVATAPRGVAVGFGSVWVASGAENVVERIDPVAGTREGDPIDVGVDPADISVGDAAVYTANFGDGTVSRIAP